MLNELIYIASIIILTAGLLTILFLLSNSYLNKVLKEADELTSNFKIENFQVKKPSIYYSIIKRFFDIGLSIIFIVVLSPVFCIIAIAIKVDSPGPAFFMQQRVGMNRRKFYAYKFRTMYVYEEIRQQNLFRSISDPRITRIGRFLRRSALDELPKLLNVLTGSMSIVGTSIATEFEYESISDDLKNAIVVYKPGLTSLWSVSQSRQSFSYENRILFDLYYLSNISIRLDFMITVRTIIMALGTTAAY